MTNVKSQKNRIVFILAGGLHLFWGVGLLFFPIGQVTAIANVCGTMHAIPAASMLIVVGMAAMSSTLVSSRYIALALLVSQQIVLILSAVAAIQCALDGHYPDGTAVNVSHLLHDQIIYVFLAIAHTSAMIQSHGNEVFEWLF